MTTLAIAIVFSVVVFGCIALGWLLWRKHEAKLHENDRKWQEHQATRLKSLVVRMKVEIDPAPFDYPELPRVTLAGLLPPPRQRAGHTSRDSGPGLLQA